MPIMTPGNARTQRGVSIVEALVALLVLSIGMLGIAVMYLESLKANRTALSRTMAIQLVNDMADRIRANRSARDKYKLASGEKPATVKTKCDTDNCTADDLAVYDLNEWVDNVDKTLPHGGDGTTAPLTIITYDPGATTADPARYTIETQWKDAGSDDYLTTRLEFTQIGTT
jgi:type IV pilus assembly protein PilV